MPHPYDTLSSDTLCSLPNEKWQAYPKGVLPLWVADMDFPTAPAIVNAIVARAQSGNLGYPRMTGDPGLVTAIRARLEGRYGWAVDEKSVWLLNGIIPGLYASVLALTSPGEEVIVQPPIYPPFLTAILNQGRKVLYNPLLFDGEHWTLDFEGLERLVTPATRMLMLCNPHNPTGRVFTRAELEQLADFALRHRLWVVSDELHSDLVYAPQQHIPLASLSPAIAERTLTLFGPTKTFNIAGLKIGICVAQNRALLERLQRTAEGLVKPPNVLAQAATLAAYTEGNVWLEDTLSYLRENRGFVASFVEQELPGVKMALPEATYLAWLDFRGLGFAEGLSKVLLERCRVALNDGPPYGPGYEGFARLNFATSRAVLNEALERIRDGLRAARD